MSGSRDDLYPCGGDQLAHPGGGTLGAPVKAGYDDQTNNVRNSTRRTLESAARI
jgi:hypothetical protein